MAYMNYARNAPEVIDLADLNLSNLSYELQTFDVKDKKNKICFRTIGSSHYQK